MITEVPTMIPAEENATPEEVQALKDVYKEEMKQFVARKERLKVNLVKAYGLILGQCTKSLRAKLEARLNWDDGTVNKIKYNPINLLKAIKEITHNHQDTRYPQESIFHAIKNVFTIKQEDNEGLTDFTKRFNNAVDIMETQHGTLPMKAYLKTRSDYQLAQVSGDANLLTEIHKQQYDRLKAFAYLKALDAKKSGKLVEDLNNQFALGNDQFPSSVTKATETVLAYRNRVNNNNSSNRSNNNNNKQQKQSQ